MTQKLLRDFRGTWPGNAHHADAAPPGGCRDGGDGVDQRFAASGFASRYIRLICHCWRMERTLLTSQ
mgnify:FL=1